MNRRLAFAAFLVSLSANALADCGDLTKRLLNIDVGGHRGYLGRLPNGLKLSFQHDFGDNGMDLMGGAVLGLNINGASVYWHNDRVYMVQALIHGKDDKDIQSALSTLLSIANTDFNPDPRLVPKGEYLRCTDGLTARILRSQIVRSQSNQVPILVMTVEHPKMKLRFECGKRPQQCENLPKGYLD
jgi:hypothetical protein